MYSLYVDFTISYAYGFSSLGWCRAMCLTKEGIFPSPITIFDFSRRSCINWTEQSCPRTDSSLSMVYMTLWFSS